MNIQKYIMVIMVPKICWIIKLHCHYSNFYVYTRNILFALARFRKILFVVGFLCGKKPKNRRNWQYIQDVHDFPKFLQGELESKRRDALIYSIKLFLVASKYLHEDGMLQLTGAIPALSGTPGMMGYGMAKAAVLQLTKSLASAGSGLSPTQSVVTILPMTLDTPNNRKFMAGADFSSWTKMDFVAEKIKSWLEDPKSRPKSGSFAKFVTRHNVTHIDFDG